jgi:hypothetical protein
MNKTHPHFVGRSRTQDGNMMTFDHGRLLQQMDENGNHMGIKLRHPETRSYTTRDGQTRSRTYDSTGSFLVGELERLDQTLHEPLAAVTWGRDIDLREDVTIADEVSSFTLSTYGATGGLGTGNGIGNGKSWVGKTADQIAGIGLDIAKLTGPLLPWGMELKYTILELESAAKLGRPIDQQKYEGMQLKHQMDIDEQVYIGDTSTGATGLVNSASVTNTANVAAGAGGSTLWSQKSPDEILTDFNEILNSAWAAAAYAVMPGRVLLPPAQFGYISTAKVSQAGNMSILKYVQENSLLTTSGKGKLDILPAKWLVGAASGGTIGTANGKDRMIAYTKDKQRVRFPMTMLQRTPVQYDSIYQKPPTSAVSASWKWFTRRPLLIATESNRL